MNLLYIFLSIFFSINAPTFSNNEGRTGSQKVNDGTTTNPGGTRGDNTNNGDYVIMTDTNP